MKLTILVGSIILMIMGLTLTLMADGWQQLDGIAAILVGGFFKPRFKD